jgi:membrane fusion protein, macrolide-specific efflux system
MNKKIWIILLPISILILGGGVWLLIHRKPQFDLSAIQRGKIVHSIYGIGTLTAAKSFTIKSGVTSTIRKLFVVEGEKVKKGARLVDLVGIGEYLSPFTGTVVSAPFKEGETVYAQASLLTLVDPRDTYLLVSIEQQGALNLKVGLPVKVSFDGLREQVFDGKVKSIFSNNSDFLAHISIESLPEFILPGMTADVAIILEEKSEALLLPLAALDNRDAVIYRDGKVQHLPVQLGLVDGAFAEILGGDLKAGDQAVLLKKETP